MSNSTSAARSGIGLGTAVFVVFLVLKLAEIGQVATWSWWWVTCPLWIPWAIVAAVGLPVLAGILILALVDEIRTSIRTRRHVRRALRDVYDD